MKRRAIVIAVALLLVGWGAWWLWTKADAPRYRKMDTPFTLLPGMRVAYQWNDQRLLERGKVWLWILSNTDDQHHYLFDLPSRKVEGELIGAEPALMNGDLTQLICTSSFDESSARNKVSRSLRRWSGGRIRIPLSADSSSLNRNMAQTRYWALNLKRNSARILGDGWRGAASIPSPSFRYAVIWFPLTNQFVFDFQESRLRTGNFGMYVYGWWDETHLLTNPDIRQSELLLVDVVTGSRIPLIEKARVNEWLGERGLTTNVLARINCVWNGDRYDFYPTDDWRLENDNRASLAKLRRPVGELQVLARDLPPAICGQVNRTGAYYVYSPRKVPGYGAVVLRDLQRNQERELVADDGSQNMSFPAFWNEGVVYIQSNALWHINLEGTEKVQLFP